MQTEKDPSYWPRGLGRRGRDRLGSVIFGALIFMLIVSGGASAAPGVLTQLAGPDGCVSEDGTGGECADGKALQAALSVAVSPDGINVYVASFTSAAVTVFSKAK